MSRSPRLRTAVAAKNATTGIKTKIRSPRIKLMGKAYNMAHHEAIPFLAAIIAAVTYAFHWLRERFR